MKKKYVYIFVFLISFLRLFSQTIHPVSIGLNLGMKAGISVIETPEGRQNGISFNSLPEFGINGFYPISKSSNLGLSLNLEYSTYSFVIKDFGKGTKYVHEASYITFNPNLYFNGITFGFGLGLPSIANMDGINIDAKVINTMIDFKFGYIYPIFEDETGIINIFFNASYMLTKVFDNFKINDPLKLTVPEIVGYPITDANNPRTASVTLGFKYDFNLNSTEAK
jgi:hypothetical protein